jgi:hypothetical protein
MTDLLANPCHLLDTQWSGLDAARGYSEISVDITVETDPGEDAGYYYANTVYFAESFTDRRGRLHGAAYAGLQTNGHSGPTDTWVGKMAIFSAWGATGGLAETGGWTSEFDEAGTGWTVRRPYPWIEGVTYRLRIGVEQERENERVWAASLLDTSDGTPTRIGRLSMPAAYGLIRAPITFHERYLGPSRTLEEIEASQVRFSSMQAGDGAVAARRWRHTHEAAIAGHHGAVWREDLADGVRSGVATPGPRRADRGRQAR